MYVQADEAEDDLIRDKIVKFLEKIPEYSGNLYIGPLRIYPSLEISGTYDDKVFNTSDKSLTTNKDRDFYETYKPKISLALPIRDHSIAFDYGFEIYEYARDYKPSSVNQDRVHRRFGGSINLNFVNGFSINMLIGFLLLEDLLPLHGVQIKESNFLVMIQLMSQKIQMKSRKSLELIHLHSQEK